MGRELRRTLSNAVRDTRHRLEAEERGLRAFIDFCLIHRNLYRIVMESQFIDESIYRAYYTTLANGYTQALNTAQNNGQIRTGDPEVQAWALMGISHFVGMRYALWPEQHPDESMYETVMTFLRHGLEAPDAQKP